ncbi:hypothetical protein D3C73_1462620 [compost metagenome]
MAASVLAALFGAGALKLGMALEMASTPVKAELPDENAFSSRNRLIPATGVPIGVWSSAGTSPDTTRNRPSPSIIKIARTNRYTG